MNKMNTFIFRKIRPIRKLFWRNHDFVYMSLTYSDGYRKIKMISKDNVLREYVRKNNMWYSGGKFATKEKKVIIKECIELVKSVGQEYKPGFFYWIKP